MEYEDIDKLTQNQNQMLDNALQKQNDIVNQQTDMNVAEIERNKEKVDKDVQKTNKALYTEYRKQSNPYGANAERLASQGLLNSGYAETTQTNLYNTYQKNITDTLNNARNLKADFDNEITRARQTGNITIAQNALEMYKQKMQLLTQEYELKNNREQFLYRKSQDALSQSNWEKEYQRQLQRDAEQDRQYKEQFDYQKQRDAVADSQWQQQYALSKKASASSSRRRSGSSSKSSSGSVATISPADNTATQKSNTSETGFPSVYEIFPLLDETVTMYAQAAMKGTRANSNERKLALQQLVEAKAISQTEANKLLGA